MPEVVCLDGTLRSRSPEETWAVLEPLLARYGITRVADLTDLDCVGIPVWTAIRPGAVTLSASQGKGATARLAAISAVMEAIELWQMEQRRPVHWKGSAREVRPPYPVAALPQRVPCQGLERLGLEWTSGVGLLSGDPVPVPVGVVERRLPKLWEPEVFRATSTGVACGNTRAEAVLHCLYEVIERHTLHLDEQGGGRTRTWIDPDNVTDSYTRSLVDRVRGAGALLDLAVVPSPYGLPVCVAFMWSEDFPLWFAGGGCHHDPQVALARAITEAAQSRLTCIAGTRDDLPSHEDVHDTAPALRPTPMRDVRAWEDVCPAEVWQGSLDAQADATAAVVEAVTGYEPIAVDLAPDDGWLSAVKVVAPGTTSRMSRAVPR